MSYNEYTFTTVKTLRTALRHYRNLAQCTDGVSATIYLDLKRALGDDPTQPVHVLTAHQRKLVQQYLIERKPSAEVAKQNNITLRVLHLNIQHALEALLEFLESNIERRADSWQPWMLDLMRDPYMSVDEIAAKVGKSTNAVYCAMTRYRESEKLPFRAVRRRVTRSQSK